MTDDGKLPYEKPEIQELDLGIEGIVFAANEGSYNDPNYDPEEDL